MKSPPRRMPDWQRQQAVSSRRRRLLRRSLPRPLRKAGRQKQARYSPQLFPNRAQRKQPRKRRRRKSLPTAQQTAKKPAINLQSINLQASSPNNLIRKAKVRRQNRPARRTGLAASSVVVPNNKACSPILPSDAILERRYL